MDYPGGRWGRRLAGLRVLRDGPLAAAAGLRCGAASGDTGLLRPFAAWALRRWGLRAEPTAVVGGSSPTSSHMDSNWERSHPFFDWRGGSLPNLNRLGLDFPLPAQEAR